MSLSSVPIAISRSPSQPRRIATTPAVVVCLPMGAAKGPDSSTTGVEAQIDWREARTTLAKPLSNHFTRAHDAAYDHLGVDAAQVQLAAHVRVDELERVLAVARLKLLAASVRFGGDLD